MNICRLATVIIASLFLPVMAHSQSEYVEDGCNGWGGKMGMGLGGGIFNAQASCGLAFSGRTDLGASFGIAASDFSTVTSIGAYADYYPLKASGVQPASFGIGVGASRGVGRFSETYWLLSVGGRVHFTAQLSRRTILQPFITSEYGFAPGKNINGHTLTFGVEIIGWRSSRTGFGISPTISTSEDVTTYGISFLFFGQNRSRQIDNEDWQ